ncbi:hypothetical protein HYW82_03495 [Candidatus Peregrinibacteria bacterium]|nr:hypothetical protein [Candidatus Peregrinibacteria bacterium]
MEENMLKIGFSKSEVLVYMALLRMGMLPASTLSKGVSLNRSSAYAILRGLVKKGIVSSRRHNGIQYFSANDPNLLIGYVDTRSRILEYHRTELLMAIPKLRSMIGKYDFKKPMVSYFEGIDGVKNVMGNSLIGSKDYFYVYLPLEKWFLAGLKNFFLDYGIVKMKNRKQLRAVVPDTRNARLFFKENYPRGRSDILYVKDQSAWGIFDDCMTIYDDKVAILHLDKGEEYGVLIESKEIAALHRHIFEATWKGLKK